MGKSNTPDSGASAPVFSTRREAIRATRVPGETPDPTPVELPVNTNKPLSLREEMMRFIRQEVSQQASKDNYETFEEFDDIDVDEEEPDLSSPYTVQMVDEPGSLLLEPEPESAVQESDSDSSIEERSEATGAEGADNTEPREVLTNNAAER